MSRISPPPRRSFKQLVQLIARRKDPDELISCVASDARMLHAARQIYTHAHAKDRGEQLRRLCHAGGISREYFDERIRLIVHALNLVERQENYYDVLGVSNDADKEEIKRSYRWLSMLLHPDRNRGDPFAADKFMQVHEAYKTLGNDGLRGLYDSSASAPHWEGQAMPRGKITPHSATCRHPRMRPFSFLLAAILLFVIISVFLSRDTDLLFWYYQNRQESAVDEPQARNQPAHSAVSLETSLVVSPPEQEQQAGFKRPLPSEGPIMQGGSGLDVYSTPPAQPPKNNVRDTSSQAKAREPQHKSKPKANRKKPPAHLKHSAEDTRSLPRPPASRFTDLYR